MMNTALTEKVIEWYQNHKRQLPWRTDKDPYKIWLSEIILQQTRIDQGTPYYEKFLSHYPCIFEMAKAPEDEILKHWQGLGYYSRARNMHHTAKVIVNDYQGIFPQDYKSIRLLKGIGDYTASILLSVCFNQPYAVVDGNVSRVVSRLFGIKDFIDKPEGQKIIKQKATEILDKQNPGDFNEALMDFGSMVCTPSNPNCCECPLSNHCYAFIHNEQNLLPFKSQKKELRKRYFHYYYLEQEGFIFVKKRNNSDIWKSLYEFPLIEKNIDTSPTNEEVAQTFGVQHCKVELVFEMKHKLTHQAIQIKFYKLMSKEKINDTKGSQLIKIQEINQYAVPKPIEKFLNLILQ